MKQTLTIKLSCTLSITILIWVTIKMQMLHCSSWTNIPTLIWKMQLACISSISCNIQHLAQQQRQHKHTLPMLGKWTLLQIRRANIIHWQSVSHDTVSKQIKARADCKQKLSEPLEHWAACDPKRSLQWRNNEKRTFEAIKKQTNWRRIMLREKLLWQESELKTLRQWLSRSRKIWGKLKMGDWQPESLK